MIVKSPHPSPPQTGAVRSLIYLSLWAPLPPAMKARMNRVSIAITGLGLRSLPLSGNERDETYLWQERSPTMRYQPLSTTEE